MGTLERLLETLSRTPPATGEDAGVLLRDFGVERRDLEPWASFEHPIEDGYGRRVVASTPRFEVLVMSWCPDDWSAIHDHGRTEWGAVEVFGEGTHLTYALSQRHLALESRHRVENEILVVDGQLVHQLGNTGTGPMLSLHVYGAAEAGSPVSADARVFDLWAGEIQWTSGGVFFCLPEASIVRREAKLTGDSRACAMHHQQMLARLDQIAARGPLPPQHARRRAALRRWVESNRA